MSEQFTDEPAEIVDRSTLERYAECPHQARLIDSGQVSNSSLATEVGNAVHAIIAEAVSLRHNDGMSANDLRYAIDAMALKARPDVQPQVVTILRRSTPILNMVCYHPTMADRSPSDILRYDGGEDDFRGQIAADLLPATGSGRTDEAPALRFTCELDLLLSTPSPEELEVIDWKSGWATWTATDVWGSFQFQAYAWLIFATYPACQRVRVRVAMLRDGYATSPVEFVRSRDMLQIYERLSSAAAIYRAHAKAEPQAAPAWPAPERCSICPAAQRCQAASRPAVDLAKDSAAYLRQYVAIQNAAEKMHANLTAAVRKSGSDFIFSDVAFGTGKPKQARAATCDVYRPDKITITVEK